MIEKKREIFIKLEEIAQIVKLLEDIKVKEVKLKSDFNTYDSLNLQENKIFENWSSYFEEINQKLNHIAL